MVCVTVGDKHIVYAVQAYPCLFQVINYLITSAGVNQKSFVILGNGETRIIAFSCRGIAGAQKCNFSQLATSLGRVIEAYGITETVLTEVERRLCVNASSTDGAVKNPKPVGIDGSRPETRYVLLC
jgi:hypothetical protein